ncbi:MAG: DUF1800 domain-containing protein [Acidobacteria bacterium]|nr:DUF1800 domain-containing protein [Acidobacteriota bacterium]
MANQYDRMAHLLRRAGFGARPDEIEASVKLGFEATVEQLVNFETVPENPAMPATPVTRDGTFNIRLLTPEDTAVWWLERMVKTRRPLQERMVLFWHDHFATSVSKVGAPNGYKYLYWQNLLFRQHATGNFRSLVKAINRDPAMLWWLDNYLNVKGSPNENYARELMEIFTLGLDAYFAGVYTEPDVQQAARAFTGWGLLCGDNLMHCEADLDRFNEQNGPLATPAEVVQIPPNTPDNSIASQRHDYTDKTVFGKTGNFNGDDIVDLIFDQEPQRTYAARMICTKLFEYFAYENPETQVVDHLAAVALRSNFDLKAILRDLFLNTKEFYSDKAMHALVKWPAYYAINAIRLTQATFNYQQAYGGGFGGVNIAPSSIAAMGQVLLNPPDVFGWPGKSNWITTSQLFARANFASNLTAARGIAPAPPGIPIDAVLATAGLNVDSTAEEVADSFIKLLVQAVLHPQLRQLLIDYLRKDDNGNIGTFRLDEPTKDKKIRGLIHLLLSRPEAQTF